MRYLFFALIAFTAAIPAVFAQNASSNEVDEALRQALTRIANEGRKVEHLVYDGMTVSEVETILGLNHISIRYAGSLSMRLPREGHFGMSSHGEYVILWSEMIPSSGAVVTGYFHTEDGIIRHNRIGQ
jgi:hypothetical protein